MSHEVLKLRLKISSRKMALTQNKTVEVKQKSLSVCQCPNLYDRVPWSVTVLHHDTRPSVRVTLAPPERKSRHRLSSSVRKAENKVLQQRETEAVF